MGRVDLPRPRTLPEWRDQLRVVDSLLSGWQWAVGDFLATAEKVGAENDLIAWLKNEPRLDPSVLAEWQHTAERFKPSQRAVAVPFGWYEIVSNLPTDKAIEILMTARDEGWTTSKVRSAAAATRRKKPAAKRTAKKAGAR